MTTMTKVVYAQNIVFDYMATIVCNLFQKDRY